MNCATSLRVALTAKRLKAFAQKAHEGQRVLGLARGETCHQSIGDGEPTPVRLVEQGRATLGKLYQLGAAVVRVERETHDAKHGQFVDDALHGLADQAHVPCEAGDR